ncbi:MAG: DUF1223 domain-containing protein [Hyphomicrobium sp.]|nr:DUF1223 domain-containing protein [Hyphomicrobium sp.]
MVQNIRTGIVGLLALVVSVSASSSVPASDRITGVVELFTSQGCSSCPPADALLQKIARRPGVLALSLPVDYWDRLSWKDTFGAPAHSARQRAYARERGDGAVYTPQAVVNGRQHMNGASRIDIDRSLTATAVSLSVPVTVSKGSRHVSVEIGTAPAGSAMQATVLLMPYLHERAVEIGRGENAHRAVTYTNIVRMIVELGPWTGGPARFEVPIEAFADADGAAVILQMSSREEPGPIVGAARLTF